MNKGKFVQDLVPGSSFTQSIFIIASPDFKQGKAGGPYAMFDIEDRTGSKPAKKWNVTTEETEMLSSNTFFAISGNVETGTYLGQITVQSIKPIDSSAVNMDDFLSPLPEDHAVHYDRFINLVKSVKNPHLKTLLRTVFGTPADMLKKFRDAVAAKSMHHSHRGGLIEHSAEVATMCDKMCEVLPDLDRDLLVTCALLHDIGKLEEMDHGIRHGDYTADGTLIGHIVLGTQIVLNGMGPDFPPHLRKLVMHMILSHHKTLDFGSPKEPATAEAQVLAACDDLSAKTFQHRYAVKNARAGQVNVKINGSSYAYVGSGAEPREEIAREAAVYKEALLAFEVECARLPIYGTGETRDVSLPLDGADYLLRINDTSMCPSGLLPGDLVFIARGPVAQNDCLVAAKIDGSVEVVRRLVTDKSQQQVLEADDPSTPKTPVGHELTISGRVTGLIRDL